MSGGSFLSTLVLIAAALAVRGAQIQPTRVKRGILGTVTSTVYKTISEKHYVPASCVHVAPNLPDCRNVRFMNYPSFDSDAFRFFSFGNELWNTALGKSPRNVNTTNSQPKDSATIHIQGWAEYLGLYRPTVTITELKIEPTTVLDPRIMVTYDIRGCKPHDLPHDLARCPEDNPLDLEEILPTSTVLAEFKPTLLPEEGSEVIEEPLGGPQKPTEGL